MDENTYTNFIYKIITDIITNEELQSFNSREDIPSKSLIIYYLSTNNKKIDIEILQNLNVEPIDVITCLSLGIIYDSFDNIIKSPNEREKYQEKSLNFLLKATENKLGYAEYFIAEKYYFGKGVSRNVDTANEWYSKSVQKGNTMSIVVLGLSKEEEEEAQALYKEAAEKNNLLAMSLLPLLDNHKYYVIAARQKHKPSMYKLSCYYYLNNMYKDAIPLLEELSQMKFHLKVVTFDLGLCYEHLENYDDSLFNYKIAASLGSGDAKTRLADYTDNFQEKLKLLDEASDTNSFACQLLYNFYLKPLLYNEDLAIKYAIKGHNLGDKKLSYFIVMEYLKGKTLDKDLNKALEMLEILDTDDANAILSVYYLTGKIDVIGLIDGKTNYEKGIKYLLKMQEEAMTSLLKQNKEISLIYSSHFYPNTFTMLNTKLQDNIMEIYICCNNIIPTELQEYISKLIILLYIDV
jgi:TPR repeat protein